MLTAWDVGFSYVEWKKKSQYYKTLCSVLVSDTCSDTKSVIPTGLPGLYFTIETSCWAVFGLDVYKDCKTNQNIMTITSWVSAVVKSERLQFFDKSKICHKQHSGLSCWANALAYKSWFSDVRKHVCLVQINVTHLSHSFFSNNETCNAKKIVFSNQKSYSCNIHQKYFQYDFFCFTM